MLTSHLAEHDRRQKSIEAADAARREADLQRYAAGEKTPPILREVIGTYKTDVPVELLHNEVVLAVKENTPTSMTWIFNRCYGHRSGWGLRIIDLELTPGSNVWRVVTDDFMARNGKI